MRKRLGAGAKVRVLVSRLHPKNIIADVFPNATKNEKTDKSVVVEAGLRLIRHEEKEVIVFRHEAHGNCTEPFECWALSRFVHDIVEEGPPDDFFPLPGGEVAVPAGVVGAQEEAGVSDDGNGGRTGAAPAANPNQAYIEENQPPVPDEIQRLMADGAWVDADDVNMIRNMFPDMIDDDNQPAPENIPTDDDNNNNIFTEWGHSGNCFRAMDGGQAVKPKLLNIPRELVPTLLQLFEIFFFKEFVNAVIIVETSKRLSNDNQRPLSYGEFLRWIGVWLFLATIEGPDRLDFWSLGEIDMFDGAPFRLNHIMSRNRFEAILKAIFYSDREPPPYKDPFWEVRQMLEEWNHNMTEQFTPGWVSCLDESMSPWTNKYTCPGWMFVPRKPHPFGNEYHTVCCSLCGILWSLELVEGKDAPQQAPKPRFSNLGNTVGLMLRVLSPIFAKGLVVILDSGFCVLKGIVELKKRGVYASALIKKRRYWPKFIRGEEIKQHFNNKQVGDCDAWKGSMDEVKFHVYAMKEPDYVMSLMSTYGTNQRKGKVTRREWIENRQKQQTSFQYPEVVGNYFLFCHSVYDHNNK